MVAGPSSLRAIKSNFLPQPLVIMPGSYPVCALTPLQCEVVPPPPDFPFFLGSYESQSRYDCCGGGGRTGDGPGQHPPSHIWVKETGPLSPDFPRVPCVVLYCFYFPSPFSPQSPSWNLKREMEGRTKGTRPWLQEGRRQTDYSSPCSHDLCCLSACPARQHRQHIQVLICRVKKLSQSGLCRPRGGLTEDALPRLCQQRDPLPSDNFILG